MYTRHCFKYIYFNCYYHSFYKKKEYTCCGEEAHLSLNLKALTSECTAVASQYRCPSSLKLTGLGFRVRISGSHLPWVNFTSPQVLQVLLLNGPILPQLFLNRAKTWGSLGGEALESDPMKPNQFQALIVFSPGHSCILICRWGWGCCTGQHWGLNAVLYFQSVHSA